MEKKLKIRKSLLEYLEEEEKNGTLNRSKWSVLSFAEIQMEIYQESLIEPVAFEKILSSFDRYLLNYFDQ